MFDKLIEFLLNSIRLFQFWVVIRTFEAGVVLRFGRFHRMARTGLRWPFNIEEVLYDHINLRSSAVGPQSVTTKDGIAVVISAVLMYRVEDIKQWLLECEVGHVVLDNLTCGLMSRKVMDHTWEELVVMDLADELAKVVRRQAKKIGVEVVQMQVTDFTKSLSFRLIGHQLM